MSVIGNIAYIRIKKKCPVWDKVFVEYLTLRKKYYPIDKITIGQYHDDLFDG